MLNDALADFRRSRDILLARYGKNRKEWAEAFVAVAAAKDETEGNKLFDKTFDLVLRDFRPRFEMSAAKEFEVHFRLALEMAEEENKMT